MRTFGTWASIVGLAPSDRYLVVNPFFHTFGYKAGILACLMAGATVVPEAVFDARRVMERIAAERISVLPGPPTLYQGLLAEPGRGDYDLSSLRLGVTGAAVVPVELVHAMSSELGFDTVLTAYGLTESCGTVTMCRRDYPPEVIAGTSGRAIPGLEVRAVVDGRAVAQGEPGEIVVRGYTVMEGYWEDEAATAAAIDAEGWLHTGDIGVMDAAGNVTITDRVKDMFVVGGFNAYPAEIEAILRRYDGVAQVAVVGVPDARMGEVGCAFVVPTPERGGASARGRRGIRERAHRLGPPGHGQLQGAASCRGGRQPAPERQRESAQARVAGEGGPGSGSAVAAGRPHDLVRWRGAAPLALLPAQSQERWPASVDRHARTLGETTNGKIRRQGCLHHRCGTWPGSFARRPPG